MGPRSRRPAGACIGAVACLAVALGGCGVLPGPTPVPLQRLVRLVVVDTFSGADAASGALVQNGIQVAVDRLNASGGVLGDRVAVVAADGEGSPSKTTELVRQQLAAGDVALLVGPGSTSTYLAVKDAIGGASVPDCVTDVGDDAVSGAPTTFRSGASDQAQVAALLAALQRTRPEVRKVGMVDDGADAAAGLDRELSAQAGQFGLTYAGRATAAAGDERSAVQDLASRGVQGLVVSAAQDRAADIAGALGQLPAGARPVLLGFGGLAGYDVPTALGDDVVGTMLATTNRTYLTDEPMSRWPAGYRAFVQAAAARDGYAPNGIDLLASPEAADCVRQWAAAVRGAHTFAGAAVAKAWQSVDLGAATTALGVRERFTAANHTALSPDEVFVYSWVREGLRYRLRQLSGPA